MGINALNGLTNGLSAYQASVSRSGVNVASDGLAGQPTFAVLQGNTPQDWLVSLGIITPAEEQGLQMCTTLISETYSASSSVSASVNQQSVSVATPDGAVVSASNAQVNVQTSSSYHETEIYEDHLLTTDGRPIDLLCENVSDSDGKDYTVVCMENLNPAGVVKNLKQAIDSGELTGNDIVAASQQAYSQILQLLTALPQSSDDEGNVETYSDTISSDTIEQAGAGTAEGTPSTSQSPKPSQAGTSFTDVNDAMLKQANALFDLFGLPAAQG